MRMRDKFYGQMMPYAPPGIHIYQEVSYWIWLMVISTLWCLQYVFRYIAGRNALYEIKAGKKILQQNVIMPHFDFLTKDLFEVFSLVIIFCVLVVVYHYYYHYQGSKMMYLMRRLPNKWEVHIRCIALPIVACVISIIYMFVLRMLFYAIYILCTPAQCLNL